MEHLLPELADLPPRLTLDGELVAFGEDKLPSFPRLCERMLHGRRRIPIAYMIFDVLEWDGLELLN
jgi:ATP-dependent DNA ligase